MFEKFKVHKLKVNFVIDALMFICLMSMTGLGLLMKFVLIPGKERWVKYGRNVELTLQGMDRHEWGTIHLYIGLTLLGLLVLHIILHWKMILDLYQRLIGNQGARRTIASVFIISCIILVVSPFLVKPEVQELGRGEGRHRAEHNYAKEIEETTEHPEKKMEETAKHPEKSPPDSSDEKNHYVESSIEVRGYMTLSEVAEKYSIPIDYLKKKLGLPEQTSDEEKLGWLRKRYDFKMNDVRRIIDEYNKPH